MGQHDLSYRDFFSHPRMIRDLLCETYPREKLAALVSPVAELFRLETSRNLREVRSSVGRLRERLPPTEAALRETFSAWLRRVVLPRLRLPDEDRISVIQTLEDIETMLAESIDRWERELLEKGREEGLQEGRQEGEARLVLRQLRLKFGPLEPAIEERVRSADPDRLLEWGERILTAGRLEDVFRD